MKRPHGKREAPFSLRLTFEERAQIEANAGSMPVGAYIKSLLLADDALAELVFQYSRCRIVPLTKRC